MPVRGQGRGRSGRMSGGQGRSRGAAAAAEINQARGVFGPHAGPEPRAGRDQPWAAPERG